MVLTILNEGAYLTISQFTYFRSLITMYMYLCYLCNALMAIHGVFWIGLLMLIIAFPADSRISIAIHACPLNLKDKLKLSLSVMSFLPISTLPPKIRQTNPNHSNDKICGSSLRHIMFLYSDMLEKGITLEPIGRTS